MKTYTLEDLEAILTLAAGSAQRQGIDKTRYTTIFHEAQVIYDAQQTQPKTPFNNIISLYQRVGKFPWFIESFQMAIKRNEIHPLFPPKRSTPEVYGVPDWDSIYTKVNSRFQGSNLTSSKRGDQKIFVWLSSIDKKDKILESYGYAHQDGYQRVGMHYFAVVGDTQTLQQVLTSFETDPTNFSLFVKEAFEWENLRSIATHQHGRAQPDLMYHPNTEYRCNELIISPSPDKIIKKNVSIV
ncbi:MAG: hypothetical protein WC254_01255 [Candidatus Woesearchaeota archaeon]|jgi:hypothetical protein